MADQHTNTTSQMENLTTSHLKWKRKKFAAIAPTWEGRIGTCSLVHMHGEVVFLFFFWCILCVCRTRPPSVFSRCSGAADARLHREQRRNGARRCSCDEKPACVASINTAGKDVFIQESMFVLNLVHVNTNICQLNPAAQLC